MAAMVENTESIDMAERTDARRSLVLRSAMPRAPASHVLVGQTLVIGRDEAADIRLYGAKMSRRHAEIYRQGPLYALHDLGSRNGTYVNGQRVEHCAVRAGMVVRFGEWLGTVDELEEDEVSTGFSELAPGVFGGALLGRSMRALDRLASSSLPVVFTGSIGTGKSVFARTLHARSGRQGLFQTVDCAVFSAEVAQDLCEVLAVRPSPDAAGARANERARSTLFLDNLSGLPIAEQPRLLHVLKLLGPSTFPGSISETQPVRLIAAANESLKNLVSQGRLRGDLSTRLNGAEIRLPMLQEGANDVPSLFHRFMVELSGGACPEISVELYERLCLHPWPGNVRELVLLARRLLAEHALDPALRLEHLPEAFATLQAADGDSPNALETRREHDLRRLRHALKQSEGNISRAATLAGVSRQRAYRLFNEVRAAE